MHNNFIATSLHPTLPLFWSHSCSCLSTSAPASCVVLCRSIVRVRHVRNVRSARSVRNIIRHGPFGTSSTWYQVLVPSTPGISKIWHFLLKSKISIISHFRTDFLVKNNPRRVRRRLAQRLYPVPKPKSTWIIKFWYFFIKIHPVVSRMVPILKINLLIRTQ